MGRLQIPFPIFKKLLADSVSVDFRSGFGFCVFFWIISCYAESDGVRYRHLELPGPISIHLLEVDPQCAHLRAVHAGDCVLSLETTSSLAKRHGAAAAVNGSFFRMEGVYAGSCSGILKIANEWFSSPKRNRGALGWKEGGKLALIDRLDFYAALVLEDTLFPIDGINQPENPNMAILYNSFFYPSTLTQDTAQETAILEDKSILSASRACNSLIPGSGYVYSIGAGCSFALPCDSPGKHVQLLAFALPQLNPATAPIWNTLEEIVGGTPVLVWNGEVVFDFSPEQVSSSFLLNAHPRTAVGILPNGNLVFAVVDGRHLEVSKGMSMEELAHLMYGLGCSFALNLDGGGSSTMYYDGKVVNVPSGADEDSPGIEKNTERPVSDAILIFSNSDKN